MVATCVQVTTTWSKHGWKWVTSMKRHGRCLWCIAMMGGATGVDGEKLHRRVMLTRREKDPSVLVIKVCGLPDSRHSSDCRHTGEGTSECEYILRLAVPQSWRGAAIEPSDDGVFVDRHYRSWVLGLISPGSAAAAAVSRPPEPTKQATQEPTTGRPDHHQSRLSMVQPTIVEQERVQYASASVTRLPWSASDRWLGSCGDSMYSQRMA